MESEAEKKVKYLFSVVNHRHRYLTSIEKVGNAKKVHIHTSTIWVIAPLYVYFLHYHPYLLFRFLLPLLFLSNLSESTMNGKRA